MPTKATQYESKIAGYATTAQLLKLWQQIQAGNTAGWPAGRALEYMIVRAFELEGAAVRFPFSIKGASGIAEQIDGAIHTEGLSFLVESKDYSKKNIGVEPIAKLKLRLAHRPPSTMGLVFARTELTDAAMELAILQPPRNVIVWYGDELETAMRSRKMIEGLRIKYRYAVDYRMPDYDLRQEGWP